MIFDELSPRELECLRAMSVTAEPFASMPGTARKLFNKGLVDAVAGGGYRITETGQDIVQHAPAESAPA